MSEVVTLCGSLIGCLPDPLLPNESCNLGSINLAQFVSKQNDRWVVNWTRLREVVQLAVRFLDNVIEVNRYPLPQIEEMTKANRKIGLGVMGFADLLLRLGIPYNSPEGVECARDTMRFIQETGHQASAELAAIRGVFPNYVGSTWNDQGVPMRNATVTTIAPTGTISIIAGCSSGIEPLFALAFTRNVLDNERLLEVNPIFAAILKERGLFSPERMEEIAEVGSVSDMGTLPEDLRSVAVTAHDVSPEWHIRMQAAFQEFTDNAVSKTVNFPESATRDAIERVYRLAYELQCKGVTVYRSGSRESEVLTVGSASSKEHSSPRRRPQITVGRTERVKTGCGTLYVTINEDDQGICEVFTTIGKAGGCAGSFSEATARLISLSLRSGMDPAQISRQLRAIRCPHPMWQNGRVILSCPDAIAQVMEGYLAEQRGEDPTTALNTPFAGSCPDCGGRLQYESGCSNCVDCGFSRCG